MQRLFLGSPIKPATKKQLYSLLFSIFWLPLTLLGQEKYYVYSITGEALIIEKNSNRKLKIFDKLNDNSSVILRGNSKISFIAESTSKYFEISTPGTYPINTIIKQQVKQSNTTENVLKYIYSKFVEKGKIYHGDPQYKTTGVILRGDEENILLLPNDKTFLFNDQSFIPVLSDSLVKIKNEFTVLISQNGQNIREFTIKQGELINLQVDTSVYAPVIMSIKWQNKINTIQFVPVQPDKRTLLNNDLLKLKTEISNLTEDEQLLAYIIFYESKNCFIEAINYYEKHNNRYPNYKLTKKEFLFLK